MQHIEIDWVMAVARALLLKQLSESDIYELHEMEDTRAERYFGKYEHYQKHKEAYPNWLIYPFEIQRIFFKKCEIVNPTKDEKNLIIDLISRQIPKDVEPWPSHSGSVEYQHAWDWNCYKNIAVLEVAKKNKPVERTGYMEKYDNA